MTYLIFRLRIRISTDLHALLHPLKLLLLEASVLPRPFAHVLGLHPECVDPVAHQLEVLLQVRNRVELQTRGGELIYERVCLDLCHEGCDQRRVLDLHWHFYEHVPPRDLVLVQLLSSELHTGRCGSAAVKLF